MTIESLSSPVQSSQAGPHARLGRVLDARLRHAWLAPPHAPTVAAFGRLEQMIAGMALPRGGVVLDSGCGGGESTRHIARALPGCLVIGVDKSALRLAKTGARCFPHREGDAIWLRADLPTFWRLAAQAGWRLRRHYLLYPNPWPKPGQLRRRWHAHPAFPELLALGGKLEMRCNWRIYADEFAAALRVFTGQAVEPRLLEREPRVTTPFERKYRASGHALYSVSLALGFAAVK